MMVLYNACASSAEYTDTIPSNIINKEIFIIGVQNLDSLIYLHISPADIWIVTKNRNLEYFSNFTFDVQPYLIFDSMAYMVINWSYFIWDYLLDNVSSELKAMLLKSYPYYYVQSPPELYEDRNKIYRYERLGSGYPILSYEKLQCKLFLVLLVHLPFYNEYLSLFRPLYSYFPNHPAEQGMFIKILIPLRESEDE
jgi:hypothetical protein